FVRTCRSMPFRDVIGHRRLTGLLSRSIERATLPPSLIFSGPPGVGKRFTAVATAQALNCPTPTSSDEASAGVRFDACGTCPACVRIARGVHPEFIVVERGDNGTTKIEQVREVVDRSGYRPFEGRRRAIVFDAADALVSPAQNALLKTLEEPPSSSIFI